MKTITKQLFIAALVVLAACKGGNEVEKKQAELAELKSKQAELAKEIGTLEKYIAEHDTTKKVNTKIKLVAVTGLNKGTFSHFIELNGKIETDQNVLITAQSAGTITKVIVKRGQHVNKGQVLASIDGEIISKGISELKANLSLVTTIYDKQKRLWEQQIGTEIQYLQAKTNKEALELKLSSLQKQYDMTLLKSTISGTIDEVFIKEGENIAPGMPGFRIINNSGYKLVAEVPESYLSKIGVGNDVQVTITDLNKTLNSKIINVSDVISPSSRTFRIEMDLNGDMKQYKANMLAYLKIEDFKKANSLTAPINLVERQEDKDYIFVANGTKAAKREVKVGKIYKSTAEIIEGLNEGDKLITTGYQDLVDGQDIKY